MRHNNVNENIIERNVQGNQGMDGNNFRKRYNSEVELGIGEPREGLLLIYMEGATPKLITLENTYNIVVVFVMDA